MKYYSITEAAGLLKISPRRLQQLCTSGEIAGAEKAGRKWRIPESSISAMLGKSENQKKPLPVGISDYKDASTEYYYVDKTLLMRDYQNQIDAERRENEHLRQENNMLALQASQTAQNAFIQQGFANEVDALYNRLNACPVPTTPVYGRTPIFTCGGCGCNGNTGFIG